jgi:hypothetical protein
MRIPLTAAFLASAALFAAASVQAQTTTKGVHPAGHAKAVPAAAKPAGKFIHPADRNKDQRIDLVEWVDMGEPRSAFAKADKNRDGKLDGPEFVAAKYPDTAARR